MHQVCSQGVQHTLVYILVHRLSTIRAYIAHTCELEMYGVLFVYVGVCVVQCIQGAWCLCVWVSFIECCGLYR